MCFYTIKIQYTSNLERGDNLNKYFRELPGDWVLFVVMNIGFLPFGLFLQTMAGDSGEMPSLLYSPAFYLIILPNLFFILYFIRKYRTTKLKGKNTNSFEGGHLSKNPIVIFLHRHNITIIILLLLNVTGLISLIDIRKMFELKESSIAANFLIKDIIPNVIIVAAYLLFYFLYLKKRS